MLNINESLFANIIEQVNGENIHIATVNANLNQDGIGFNLSFNILNKDALVLNKSNVQLQVDEFIASIKTKMTEMAYDIHI